MLRIFGSILVGLLVAIATMLVLQFVGATLFPADVVLVDEDDLARLIASASTGQLLWVLAGWCLASVAGAWIAALCAAPRHVVAGVGVGALVVAGVALNVAVLPHPPWIAVAGLALPVPLAWLAARLAARSTPRATAAGTDSSSDPDR